MGWALLEEINKEWEENVRTRTSHFRGAKMCLLRLTLTHESFCLAPELDRNYKSNCNDRKLMEWKKKELKNQLGKKLKNKMRL